MEDDVFSARTLVSSPGYHGPAGGLAGGVSSLLPHGINLLDQEEIVPGNAISATAQHGDHKFRVVS
eukprot:3640596-Pyramimonas_sp.AAC.1